MKTVLSFFKQNYLPVTAWLLALLSVILVPVDSEYAAYFDWRTLISLFAVMLVVGAYKNIKIFTIAAKSLLKRIKSTRGLVLTLVFITYFFSVFIANDMALLTFLPLTLAVFARCDKPELVGFTMIMQTVAANLGGMIMPFGNPQSLFLYTFYNISVLDFVIIMLPPFLLSFVLIFFVCFFAVKREAVLPHDDPAPKLDRPRAIVYAVCGLAVVLAVFRLYDTYIACGVVAALLIIVDFKALGKVDWGLLFTFTAFFVFANNMARLPAVNSFVSSLLAGSVLLTGVLSCQFISNVPTAIFLSSFTSDYTQLLVAVNIGGVGTPVASLASLIALKSYGREFPHKMKGYILRFICINLSFIIVLTGFSFLILSLFY